MYVYEYSRYIDHKFTITWSSYKFCCGFFFSRPVKWVGHITYPIDQDRCVHTHFIHTFVCVYKFFVNGPTQVLANNNKKNVCLLLTRLHCVQTDHTGFVHYMPVFVYIWKGVTTGYQKRYLDRWNLESFITYSSLEYYQDFKVCLLIDFTYVLL